MSSESFLALLGAFAACALLTPLVIRVAPRIGLLDVPNERSSHAAPTPRGGGLSVLIAAGSAVLWLAPWSSAVGALIGGAAALGAVGLLDDLVGLSPKPRLAAQVTVPMLCAIIATDRTGAALVGATVVSVVWCASYVNAFNFMDGINGISASQAAITAAFLAFVASDLGNRSLEIGSWALAGASIGFLPFNSIRPRVFLGDVGSYGVGFALAAIGLLLWDAGGPVLVLLGPFLLYLADTSTVLLRRWRRGDSLFEAHREHAYQRLVEAGWRHEQVAGLCAAITMVASGLMFATLTYSTATQAVALGVVAILVAVYLTFVRWHADRSRGSLG